ncbi:hypothetical protein [Parvularcula marina]|uniref:hypothetical protein n=1 Tax=Parvularcula marina TaxID=2292771 RepID=UPI0011C02B95|nr:hypothetical protein [Parvularcula marina]
MSDLEADLKELFSCEPDRKNPDGRWSSSWSTYSRQFGDVSVELKILPAAGEFRLLAKLHGKDLCMLESRYNAVLTVEITDMSSVLKICDSTDRMTFVRLEPNFFIGQLMEDPL